MKIIFPQIGEVNFVQVNSAKNIRISLKTGGAVRVTVPKRSSINVAKEFVSSKTDWILKTKEKIVKQEQERHTVYTPETIFSTYKRQLQLIPWKLQQFDLQLSKEKLKIFFPHDADLQLEKNQQVIRDYIIKALKEEAREYLPKRTEQLAAEHGFSFCGVSVKNLSSRWGSCSAKNHINLNIHLMRMPQHLSDYVILHELTHTVHKNHGPRFWQELNKITNFRAKSLTSEIKKFKTSF